MTSNTTITPVIAAGSTASPYLVQVNITQMLCSPACISNTPLFSPTFSLVGFSQVSEGGYVATVHVEGSVCYVPCGSCSCCTKTQVLSQNFTIPFASATAPTAVTITQGTPVNALSAPACSWCSRVFISETPITLTVTA